MEVGCLSLPEVCTVQFSPRDERFGFPLQPPFKLAFGFWVWREDTNAELHVPNLYMF